jgi:hypothetical protein
MTNVFAKNKDVLKSYYSDRTFISFVQIDIDASDSILNSVVDDFIYEMKYDLESLMQWALKDMKLRSERDDFIIFNFKSMSYDEKRKLLKGVGDVEISGVIELSDLVAESKLSKFTDDNDRVKVEFVMQNSDDFIKKSTADFYVWSNKDGCCSMSIKTNIKFGWFFNLFITQPVYRYIMEWRIYKMMKNIQLEAERREKILRK